jgi:outer membrane protein insertion porin family
LNATLLLPVGDGALDKRLQIFIDGGQVFANDQSIELDDIRFSAGVGFNWISPVGPLSISYSIPLNEVEADPLNGVFGDEVEKFQFSVGSLIQ